MFYRVVAISTEVAEAVRRTGVSPGYGHPAHTEVAAGHGPCRHCLQTFRVGDENRILFTYDPFAGTEKLPLPGPVFIHEKECARYPADGGLPAGIGDHRLTINAYARGRELKAQAYATGVEVEAAIRRLLDHPDVDYLHVRNTEAGCFDLQVERSP